MWFRIVRVRPWMAAIAVCAVVGLLLCGTVGQDATVSASTANWGLSFRENGQTPVGNASASALLKHRAYFVGDTSKKTIYLTFDAGYENGYTAPILDTLKKHEVPAAFFVVKHYVESAPDLVKRMVAEGHIVGNHTASHPDMSAIADRAAFEKELKTLEQAYEDLIGEKMKRYYRPPQGKYSEENLKMASEMGYSTFFWSLAYVDWYTDKQPSADYALDKLLPRTHNGAIVLLHSTSATNAAILDQLITQWKAAGYTFGTLDDLCR